MNYLTPGQKETPGMFIPGVPDNHANGARVPPIPPTRTGVRALNCAVNFVRVAGPAALSRATGAEDRLPFNLLAVPPAYLGLTVVQEACKIPPGAAPSRGFLGPGRCVLISFLFAGICA